MNISEKRFKGYMMFEVLFLQTLIFFFGFKYFFGFELVSFISQTRLSKVQAMGMLLLKKL